MQECWNIPGLTEKEKRLLVQDWDRNVARILRSRLFCPLFSTQQDSGHKQKRQLTVRKLYIGQDYVLIVFPNVEAFYKLRSHYQQSKRFIKNSFKILLPASLVAVNFARRRLDFFQKSKIDLSPSIF